MGKWESKQTIEENEFPGKKRERERVKYQRKRKRLPS